MRRENSGGQALVEFTLVIGVFMASLLGALSASVYTIQRSAAVTGVAAGARVAAGGTAGAAGANTPNLAGALRTVARVIEPVMIGTRIRQVSPPGDCPEASSIHGGEIDVCAVQRGDIVTVRVRGKPANASVPGLDWSLDLVAEVHAVTFKS
jgi:hypothetical protein